MRKAELFLVGTVHGDPQGFNRAWKILDYLRPHLVTVEISRFSLRYRQKQAPIWQHVFNQALSQLPPEAGEHPAIRRVAAQIRWPFEYLVACQWSRGHGVPWRPVDVGGPSRHHLPRFTRELLTAGNLRALWESSPPSPSDYVYQEYQRAHFRRQYPGYRVMALQDQAVHHREGLQAQRLRRWATPGRRLVHFGGWEHLIPWADGSGLAHLLADLHPVLMLLDEADKLKEQELTGKETARDTILVGGWHGNSPFDTAHR